MRARNIKPGFFKNEILGQADPLLSLAFQGLWCLADREGRLENRPLRIKAEVFPYRYDLDIHRYLTELSRLDFIRVYEVDGKSYIEIINFKKHQSPHHTEKDSELPENPNNSDSCVLTVGSPLSLRENPPDSLIPDSLIQDNTVRSEAEQYGECENENQEQKTMPEEPKKKNDYPQDFNSFYSAYPKTNGSKKKAYAAWKKARDKPDIKSLLAIIEAQKRTDRWMRGVIPHPETWLNQARWETAEGPTPQQSVQAPREFDLSTIYGEGFRLDYDTTQH